VDEDEEEDREGRRRTRFRTHDGSYVETSAEALGEVAAPSAASEAETAQLAAAALVGELRGLKPVQEDEEEDPVVIYSEMVRQAIANSRRVFHILVAALVRTYGSRDGTLSLWQALCGSLLRRVLGSFADAEKILSLQHQQRIVLTDRAARVEDLLLGVEGGGEGEGAVEGEDEEARQAARESHPFLRLLREIYRE
jgi:hypothetical protein